MRRASIHLDPDGTFPHLFAIPYGAATGTCTVTTYVLTDEKLLGTQEDEVTIEQVALVATLFSLVHERAPL